MIEIRHARSDDLASISALLSETWHATYDAIYGVERVTAITASWHSPDALARHLDAGGLRLIGGVDGRIVATAAGALDDDSNHAKLSQLYVLRSAQGLGVGTALLNAFVANFPLAHRITLEVEPANGAAIAFYERHGFTKIGAVANCGDGTSGIRAVVMGKQLRR